MELRRYLLIPLVAATCASAQASNFQFDTVHTQVFFSASHLGISNPVGRMRVKSGFIQFDSGDWSKAKVDALVDTASLDMGDEAWNRKLRSGEFLNTDKFPTAHFVSDRVEKTGENTGVAHGKLTLLGVTRPVDLKVTYNRAIVDPYTFRYTAGFSAEAKFKRTFFGMTKYEREIGDEVTVRIEAEGLRGGDAKGQAEASEQDGT
jgi:polyisoprenoid-binding protein YceI